MAHVTAVVSQKGGVGKTTTAANLAAALAQEGHNVLLLEVDPQGALIPSLGLTDTNLLHSLVDVVEDTVTANDAVVPTPIQNLSLLPACLPHQDELGLEETAARHPMRLREVVDKLVPHFDTILLDGPPSLGHLTRMTLCAADGYVIPVQAEELSYRTLARFFEVADAIQREYNPELNCEGLLITMADLRTRMAVKVINQLHENYGDRVLVNMVPRTVSLQEMPDRGKPTLLYAPSSRGARAYREVASEILTHRGQKLETGDLEEQHPDRLLEDLEGPAGMDAPQPAGATPTANASLFLTHLGWDAPTPPPRRPEDDVTIN